MVGLVLEPWVAEWKAQTNPLSYGGTRLSRAKLVYVNLALGQDTSSYNCKAIWWRPVCHWLT